LITSSAIRKRPGGPSGSIASSISKDCVGFLSPKTAANHDRAFLLHGSKRNQVLSLAEIEQYGLDSFSDADYISIYGMPPREWYRHGVRLLGRTAVECTRDMLGDRSRCCVGCRTDALVWIGGDDPFAGSCNTLFWILRHLSNAEGIAFESDPQVFEFTHRNLAILDQRVELVHGDHVRLLGERTVPEDRGIVAFCRASVGHGVG